MCVFEIQLARVFIVFFVKRAACREDFNFHMLRLDEISRPWGGEIVKDDKINHKS